MGRIAVQQLVKENQCFSCPDCRGEIRFENPDGNKALKCTRCESVFSVWNNIPVLLPNDRKAVKTDIQEFWRALYKAAYEQNDNALTRSNIEGLLQQLEKLFIHREHLAVTEMPIHAIKGKKVLEIGSGAGAHSALFASLGAKMYSMDITHDRVAATASKIDLLNNSHENICLQADAEKLPFPDNYFDIVYSNGVLHHSPDTPLAVKEAFRVLKPGGKAVIMLYSRDSFYYWFVIFLLKGVLTGNIFKYRNWLGRTTEWMSDKHQTVMNPETKVYSKRQIYRMFSQFSDIRIRKNSFRLEQIPVVGKLISNKLSRHTGMNEAGKLIYGHDWRNELSLELKLGRYFGFALNISALKKK